MNISKSPLKRLQKCKFFDKITQVERKIGVSPSGKATDSDSVTSLVQIQLPQPKKKRRISIEIRRFFRYIRLITIL